MTIFKKILFQLINKIDLSLTAKLINLISGRLGKFFALGLTDIELMPRGISVTTVYRKLTREER